MGKVVEGQMDALRMTSFFSKQSHSVASDLIRQYVRTLEAQIVVAPDELPRSVDVKQHIDQQTGRLINNLS